MNTRDGQATRDRVLFVNMPWGLTHEPSPAFGILKSVLARRGIGCDVLEAPMRLLRHLKIETYNRISQTWAASEFVFTREFEDEPSPEQIETLRRLLLDVDSCGDARDLQAHARREFETMMRLRQEIIPRYLDDLMGEIDLDRYALVGFTCLFDQNIASLAMARRIKKIRPELMIAFGGYALQRPVGPALQRSFPEMDVVGYGDGEPVIVPLWEAACGQRELATVPNITYRDAEGRVVDSERTVKISLDESPTPNYDDFFHQREHLREQYGIAIPVGEMTVESSRGCWYGAKNHCVFCGIDDESLKYRAKSAPVTIAQMDQLHRRYNATNFRFSDNIMPVRYFKDFLPELASRGAPYGIMYETKSNMKAAQIELCAKAGIRYFQPGIESFSSSQLKLMDKGVSGAQNVFTVFTMLRCGIIPLYNLIFGFPFEQPAHYLAHLKLLPSLFHLFPPMTLSTVVVMRYAPLSEDPKRFNVEGPLKAHWRNSVLYSREYLEQIGLSPDDYCYYYENPYSEVPELKSLRDLVHHQFFLWRERFFSGKAKLTYVESGEGVVIRDTRFGEKPQEYRLGRTHRLIGEVLRSQFMRESQLVEALGAMDVDAAEAREALAELVQARIVLDVDGDHLWVATTEGWFEEQYPKFFEAVRRNTEILPPHEWPDWDDESVELVAPMPESLPRLPIAVPAGS